MGPDSSNAMSNLECLLNLYELQTSVHILNISDHPQVTNAEQCANAALLEESCGPESPNS